jgi:chemotaxis protein methyltransferase CheR
VSDESQPPSSSRRIRLSVEDHRYLRAFVNRSAGLRLDEDSLPLVERRLSSRLQALGLSSFQEYTQMFMAGDTTGELSRAVELLTPKETYFFRQSYQFECLREEIVPRLKAETTWVGPLVVWSAGCATGEEAYSIAMTLAEAGMAEELSLRVLGSDLSPGCVAAAREATYSARSLRMTPPNTRARYFERTPDGYRVCDQIRSMCRFGQLDLLDADRAILLGQAHVVFCRNVLIYLDDWARRKVAETLSQRLWPGGYLLLGHSESLIDMAPQFDVLQLEHDLVHRKPGAGDPPASPRGPREAKNAQDKEGTPRG